MFFGSCCWYHCSKISFLLLVPLHLTWSYINCAYIYMCVFIESVLFCMASQMLSHVYLCNGLCWTFLINLFCYIQCKFAWIFCVAQVEGAAQWLPRANPASCLYCAQDNFLQRPINLSYYLILIHMCFTSRFCKVMQLINYCTRKPI